MRTLFWVSALLIAYVYVGYPALLMVWAKLSRRVKSECVPLDSPPTVSIVIAAYNEGARLPDRLKNLLALDYPAKLRQIIVVSDGSDDDTVMRLACYRHVVDLVVMPKVGKAAALNAGVARATGDVLVFADARQSFAPDALRALTAPFADTSIGGVSGELILGCETTGGRRQLPDRRRRTLRLPPELEHRLRRWRRGTSTIGEGVGFYWQYEKQLRSLESHVGSMLGATGAIYALRRSLWQDLPPGAILDDVLAPMRAVLAGTRVVFEPRARAYDHTSPDARAEMRRKIRTLAGNVEILRFEPRLLVPFVNPVWLQYVSHKVGRLVVPYALVTLLIASAVLAPRHPFYLLALATQLVFYLEAAYGAWLEQWQDTGTPKSVPARIARVAFAVVVMNLSAVAGLAAALSGRSVWR